MSGGGSSIGGLVGGIGGSYFGPVGSMLGSAVGSGIGGAIDKKGSRPTQTTVDPYANFQPQLGVIESALGNRLRTPSQGLASNPYVGPSPQQQQALDALANFQGAATPAFHQGLGQLQKTIGGDYLDVANVPAFQRLSNARQQIARDLFGEAAGNIAGGAAAANMYDSSARRAMQLREGRRLANQAAENIAQAGWGQYGAERGAQEAATARGLGLAPGLAESVFGRAETLRAAQQQGATAEMEARLKAQGLDDASIQNVLNYMRMRAGQTTLGPTPEEDVTARMTGIAPLLGGIMGGGEAGGAGGFSNIFGGKGWPNILGGYTPGGLGTTGGIKRGKAAGWGYM
jgi:hypothetical protein